MRIRIAAICTEAGREEVAAALGIEPVTSPPLRAPLSDDDRARLCEAMRDAEMIYVRLHGLRGTVGWFGEEENLLGAYGIVAALGLADVAGLPWADAIVLVANCYGADGDPMIDAVYEAGARLVIAGRGRNWAGSRMVAGTDRLAQGYARWLRWLGTGERAARIGLALARVEMGVAGGFAERDAARFAIINRRMA
jgi:hypothetical protein